MGTINRVQRYESIITTSSVVRSSIFKNKHRSSVLLEGVRSEMSFFFFFFYEVPELAFV